MLAKLSVFPISFQDLFFCFHVLSCPPILSGKKMPDSTEDQRGDYHLETGGMLPSLSQGSAAPRRRPLSTRLSRALCKARPPLTQHYLPGTLFTGLNQVYIGEIEESCVLETNM